MPPGMEGMSPEGLRMMMAMQGLGGMGDADADHDVVHEEDGEADDDGWVTVDDDDDDNSEEGVVESIQGPPFGEDDGEDPSGVDHEMNQMLANMDITNVPVATPEVLATRTILKVRRRPKQGAAATSGNRFEDIGTPSSD